jgi:hypothetical protein
MKNLLTKMTVLTLGAMALMTVATPLVQPAHACDECQAKKTDTISGQFRLMGNGTVRSWVKLDKFGKPSSIGVTFSETALSGLPLEMPAGMPKDAMSVEHVLALPKEAAAAGFDHISIDWAPKGHLPIGIYDVPHFDVHFYLVSQNTLGKITATGKDLAISDKQPAAKFIPAGYIMPPGTAVPRMGSHAVDTATPELSGKAFAHTFIYGYYNGQMTFVEPMVSKAFLESKQNFSGPVKVPAAYPKRGYYPTGYSVTYDELRREYTISINNLTLRN